MHLSHLIERCIEAAQRWMLLADFGRAFYERPEEEVDAAQGEIVRRFGQLQVEAIPHVEEIIKLRLP